MSWLLSWRNKTISSVICSLERTLLMMLARDMWASNHYIIRTPCCLTTLRAALCAPRPYRKRQANMWQNRTPASLGSEEVWVKFFSFCNTSILSVIHTSSFKQKSNTHTNTGKQANTNHICICLWTQVFLLTIIICLTHSQVKQSLASPLIETWSVARHNFQRDLWPQVRVQNVHKPRSSRVTFDPQGLRLQNQLESKFMKENENVGLWNPYKPPAEKPFLLRGLKFLWPVRQSYQIIQLCGKSDDFIFIPDEYLSQHLQPLCSSLHTDIMAITLFCLLYANTWRTTIIFLSDFPTVFFVFDTKLTSHTPVF